MKHMPKFAAIPLDQLRKNAAFSQRAYLCMHFALNFLINNLEKPSFIESAVNRVDGIGKCFVQTISPTMDVPVGRDLASAVFFMKGVASMKCFV